MTKPKTILGIDPDIIFIGWGVINIIGKIPHLESSGYINLSKKNDPYEKLKMIFHRTV